METTKQHATGKSLFDVFETNTDVENTGQWFNYGPGPSGDDQRFQLARSSRANKAYHVAVQQFHDKFERQLQAKTLSEEVAFEAMLDIFCTTVLLNWSGIYDRAGNLLEFSVENAKMLMRKLPELYKELTALADSRENFLQARTDADAGN